MSVTGVIMNSLPLYTINPYPGLMGENPELYNLYIKMLKADGKIVSIKKKNYDHIIKIRHKYGNMKSIYFLKPRPWKKCSNRRK